MLANNLEKVYYPPYLDGYKLCLNFGTNTLTIEES